MQREPTQFGAVSFTPPPRWTGTKPSTVDSTGKHVLIPSVGLSYWYRQKETSSLGSAPCGCWLPLLGEGQILKTAIVPNYGMWLFFPHGHTFWYVFVGGIHHTTPLHSCLLPQELSMCPWLSWTSLQGAFHLITWGSTCVCYTPPCTGYCLHCIPSAVGCVPMGSSTFVRVIHFQATTAVSLWCQLASIS